MMRISIKILESSSSYFLVILDKMVTKTSSQNRFIHTQLNMSNKTDVH